MSYASTVNSKTRIGHFRKQVTRRSAAILLGFGLVVAPSWAQQQNMPYPPAAAGPAPAQAAPAAPGAVYQPSTQTVPPTLVVPSGTAIAVRLSQYLSSDRNHPGDVFSVTLEQPLVVDGWVVARQGQSAYGRVSVAQKAKAGGGNSQLGVELSQLTLVDGQQLPVQTQLTQVTGRGPDTGQNVATVATTTGIGAIIGAAAGRGEGAGIGAAAGAAAGMLAVLLTPGKPTVMPPETVLNFQLMSPLTVTTVRSQVAFQPVSQQDYSRPQNYDRYRNAETRRPQQRVIVAPPYWYDYGWGWGYYPYSSFGYYGVYRPRIIIGSRFGHRGFRR